MTRGVRLVAAATCGLLLAGAFPPFGFWPLTLLGVGGLSLLLRDRPIRSAALLGPVTGVVFFFVLLAWMRVIGPDAWVLLTLLEAAFFALLGAGLAATGRLRAWPLWHAALWVTAEALRARLPFGGLPWGRLAFASADAPAASYAGLGGAPLVTFAMALAATLLAAAALRVPARLVSAVGMALGAFAVLAGGLLVRPLAELPTPDNSQQVTAAVVQGNVPRLGLDFLGQRQAVLRNHVNQATRLAALTDRGDLPRPDLVVWPENSSDINPYANPEAYELIHAAVRAIGVPTLVGTLVDGPGEEYVSNTGIVWSPETGPGATYVKRHPVPFGEYVPFRRLLQPWISRLDRIPRDFFAASRPGVLDLGPARIGTVICFEIAYDGIVRDTITGGGQLLVVQTNNATYGRTGQPEQQLEITRLRAIEHGRSVLVAATSGVSALIGADGKVVQRSQEFTPDLLVSSVALQNDETLATRYGALAEVLIVVLAAAAVGVAGRQRRAPARRGSLTVRSNDEGPSSNEGPSSDFRRIRT